MPENAEKAVKSAPHQPVAKTAIMALMGLGMGYVVFMG